MEWREEFDRRCRRILGIDDDTQKVQTWTSAWGDSDSSIGLEADIEIRVGMTSRSYSDLSELIRALDEVDAPLQADAR